MFLSKIIIYISESVLIQYFHLLMNGRMLKSFKWVKILWTKWNLRLFLMKLVMEDNFKNSTEDKKDLEIRLGK